MMKPDKEDKVYIPQEPNYDYKKIVKDFEKWLEKEFVPVEVKGYHGHNERIEVQEKFLAIKRKYMILK